MRGGGERMACLNGTLVLDPPQYSQGLTKHSGEIPAEWDIKQKVSKLEYPQNLN